MPAESFLRDSSGPLNQGDAIHVISGRLVQPSTEPEPGGAQGLTYSGSEERLDILPVVVG